MHSFYPGASRALRRLCLTAALVAAAAAPVFAQDASEPPADSATSEPAMLVPVGTHEWSLAGAAGWGVPIFGYGIDNAFAFPAISWARMLSRPAGHGLLRGQFEWGVEVIPFFTQFTPSRAYGVGVSPLLWRWNFEPRGHVSPFAELGGGVLWTNVDVPPDTTRANYTAHVTLAVRLLGNRARGAILGYRFEHISNGNRADTNPSVNAHAIVVGWSTFHRP